jgi:hypothetical protein
MLLAFFDGLDALIEYYIPLAKEYPIAPVIFLLIAALPIVASVFILRLLRKKRHVR